MARLSEQEKIQLQTAAHRKSAQPPSVSLKPAEQFLAFASFASQFKPAPKPVRFSGERWKL